MTQRTIRLLILRGLLILFQLVPADAQRRDLVYTVRNGAPFSEGVRPTPSTGPSLSLIAALIDHQEPDAGLPRQFQARFYLPDTRTPSVTIREINPRYNYWLGELNQNWRTQAVNAFSWNTDTVVAKLNWRGPLGLTDLGATVRLDSSGLASLEEDVAPVALYSARAPETVEGYRFVFRTEQRLRLQFEVLTDDGKRRLQGSTDQDLPAGSQSFAWKMGNEPDGWYRLRANGSASSDNAGNAKVQHKVRFYHSKRLGK